MMTALFQIKPESPITAAFLDESLLVSMEYKINVYGGCNYVPLDSYISVGENGFKVRAK